MRPKTILFLALVLGIETELFAQRQLTIDECYEKARQNFPMIKQKDLLVKSGEFNIANARAGYLPQVAIYGQATYQSDVTKVPIEVPGFTVEALPKDQYKIYAEVNQSLYDGGIAKRQSAIHQSTSQIENQKVEVELYRIRERVNQVFFGTLLIDEQLKQAGIVKNDIQSALQKTEAAIANGIAFRTSADILMAELLKTDQRVIELQSTRNAYVGMLAIFINEELSANTTLNIPTPSAISPSDPSAAQTEINRPELRLYGYQAQLFTAQQQLNNTRIAPRAGLFFQAGYGRPGLNMLDSDFASYYMGGLRFSWNLAGFYNSRRDKEQLQLNLQTVDIQKNTFLFNTKLSIRQQGGEIEKLQGLISADEKIIELRTRIKAATKAQLENGVVTANDYVREVNAEDQARQSLSLHRIQLLMTQFNYQSTIGLPEIE
jgi:outer membrane protein TolC